MPDLPSSLALTQVSGEITSAPHDANYTAIQAFGNALKDALAGGTAKQFLQATDSDTVGWAGDFGTYTPTWSSSGTAVALGNGTITGRYIQIGKLVFVQIKLTWGTTTTGGTGLWSFIVPVARQDTGAAAALLSWVQAVDSSASSASYPGFVRTTGGSASIVPSTLASPTTDYGATAPFTWATSDSLTIAVLYEAA